MWRSRRNCHMTPVLPVAEEHRPRRRCLQMPRLRFPRLGWYHVLGRPAQMGEAAIAVDMEELDPDLDDGHLEGLLEDYYYVPERAEDMPAHMIKTLVVPIPHFVEPDDKNELLNMSKQLLLTLVPKADPRQPHEIAANREGRVEGRDALPRNLARSDSAPTLKGLGQQHKVVLRGGRPGFCDRDSRRRGTN
mmetsp:Transcript_95505/g.189286  ORF Transcript_95505/g.189286 Transcript_95505/m.189286 type:complete len:191 (-) Transcript_95505:138-710(-)